MPLRKKWITVAIVMLLPAIAFAHLCNDVFIQAKDNLAVKVDIRDGQLRIGQQASFRVYLLNTMDREIVDIRLEIHSKHFDAGVQEDPTWRNFPSLKAVRKGGKKQYFTVTLRRKPRVPDGKYKIDLHLFNGKNRSMCFKTVALDSAAELVSVPKAGNITIDGVGKKEEWQEGVVISNEFYHYTKRGKYFENIPVPLQNRPRYRVLMDNDYMYCLFFFQKDAGASADKACVYVAASSDATPVKISFDRASGKAECAGGITGIESEVHPDKAIIECKIPRKLLGIAYTNHFYANFTRETGSGNKKEVAWWKANKYSEMDPITYAHLKIAE